MPAEPVDFGALVALLLVTVTSKEVAHAVGPYVAICVGAFAGAGFALTRSEVPMGVTKGSAYIVIRVFAALVLTVPIAVYLQGEYPAAKMTWTIAPIAFCIGWVDPKQAWEMLKKLRSVRLTAAKK